MAFTKAACIICAAFFFMATPPAAEINIERAPLGTNKVTTLDDLLEPIRFKHKLPALAAAVCSDTSLLAAGAVGLRKIGSPELVQVTDKFHLGSCTKSMTALLATIMVERGELSWNTTVSDIFTNQPTAEGVADITLEQLLTHRSGLPFNVSDKLWAKAFTTFRGSGQEQRELFLKEALTEKLQRKPGQKYIYSNTGYALAGAFLERRAARPWEDLVRQEIFTPLHMTSAGFGPPAFPDLVDQPWGHTFQKSEPIPQPRSDNPLSIAPAGAAHASITDFAQYAAFHLAAAQGKIPWLSKETLLKLYNPPKGRVFSSQDYALGWVVLDRDWAGGKALTHAGSNTMFFALAWIAPARNIAFVVATNAGSKTENDPAREGADETVVKLIETFLKNP